jgi:ubiquinone biosynthesis protein UbiJ
MLEPAFLAGLNHLLKSAPWSATRLLPFAGKTARIQMPPFDFGFTIDASGLCTRSTLEQPSDVVIRLPADTPLRLAQGLDKGLDKVMASATVEGNAEFATELSFVFRQLHWDAEEDLSRFLGDIPARRITQGVTEFLGWQKQLVANLIGNLSEYLRHEQQALITSADFNQFREEVVRLDVALLDMEKRSKI